LRADGRTCQMDTTRNQVLLTDGMVIAIRINRRFGQLEKTTNIMELWRRCKHTVYDVEIVLTLV
jgi:hypothetical protein